MGKSLYTVFETGARGFGTDVSRVEEVLKDRTVRTLPFMKQGVAGVLLYKSVVVPVLDMVSMLGLEQPSENRKTETVLILRHEEHRVGIFADRVRLVEADSKRVTPEEGATKGDGLKPEEIVVEGKTHAIIEARQLFAHLGMQIEN